MPRSPQQDPHHARSSTLPTARTSHRSSWPRPKPSFAGGPSGTNCDNAAELVLLLHQQPLLSNPEAAARVRLHPNSVRPWRKRWAAGDFSLEDEPGRGRKAAFSPRDEAIVKAIACEAVAQTQVAPEPPVARPTWPHAPDYALGKPISRSTVWRILDADAIKPWQYEHWIFPRDPRFAEKAGRGPGPVRGLWQGKPLGPKDHIISADEKTSIQARVRCHPTLATGPGPAAARRARVRARRGVAVPGRLGRAAGLRHGPMRGQDRDRAVRPAGRAGDGARALPLGRSGLLGRGQRLVASRGRRRSGGWPRRMRNADPGPYAGACQLAQPGGDLLLDRPAEGA